MTLGYDMGGPRDRVRARTAGRGAAAGVVLVGYRVWVAAGSVAVMNFIAGVIVGVLIPVVGIVLVELCVRYRPFSAWGNKSTLNAGTK
jgi:hypothetical protein